MNEIVLAIGTNLGNREENIKLALNELSKMITIRKISSYYYNKAMLPEDAPKDWDNEFINMAIYGITNLQPYNLLEFIKAIEENMGRKNYLKWSPRIIDIDIVFYNKLKISDDKLTIPHIGIYDREFFIKPIAEIIPEFEEKFIL